MACFEEDPVCFGFIFFGAIFLLVGGGLCGSGMESNNWTKEVTGICLLSLAILLIALGSVYYLLRILRQRRKGRHREKLKRRSRKKLAQLPLVIPVDKPVPHWVVRSSTDSGVGGANGGAAINPGLIDDFTDDEETPLPNHYRRQQTNPWTSTAQQTNPWTPTAQHTNPWTSAAQQTHVMTNSVSSAAAPFHRGSSLPPYGLRQAKSSPMVCPPNSSNFVPGAPTMEPHRCHARRNSISSDPYDSMGRLRHPVETGYYRSTGGVCDGECGEAGPQGGSFFALVSMPNLRDGEGPGPNHQHHHYHPNDDQGHQHGTPHRQWQNHRGYAVSPPVFV